jgi:hypothetical protein
MTEPPPRKRFQIHLSTAIVMMFVAGALIWANTKWIIIKVGESLVDRTQITPWLEVEGYNTVTLYGWPLPAYAKVYWVGGIGSYENSKIGYTYVTIDVVIAVIGLTAVWFLCEWLIRRRAAEAAR